MSKIQIDDDLDLIEEDSLLTDEDLKKPQLPLGRIIQNYDIASVVFLGLILKQMSDQSSNVLQLMTVK